MTFFFLFFCCWKPEAAGEIILICVRVQFNFSHVRKSTPYIYLTDRYICISLFGPAAAAEDDSVKMLLGNIRISALQTVGSQLMAEKCE